jgi:hypothetical protein
MLHTCSTCPGHSQLHIVLDKLFQANDSDVEDSIVYKQQIHDGHIEIVSMTSTVEEFTKKNLTNSRSSNKLSLYSKITSFPFEHVERNNSARH